MNNLDYLNDKSRLDNEFLRRLTDLETALEREKELICEYVPKCNVVIRPSKSTDNSFDGSGAETQSQSDDDTRLGDDTHSNDGMIMEDGGILEDSAEEDGIDISSDV